MDDQHSGNKFKYVVPKLGELDYVGSERTVGTRSGLNVPYVVQVARSSRPGQHSSLLPPFPYNG